MTAVRSPALALLPLVLFCGCAAPTVPDVVLIVIDTLRADHVGAYGYARATTPFLDQLAAEGAVFERASAPSSYTSESIASLFTGLLPSSAGAVGSTALPAPDTVSLATRFADAGSRTMLVSASVMIRMPAFLRGFEKTRFVGAGPMSSRTSPAVTKAALELVGKRGAGRPLFLYVHYLDPHGPYNPPPVYGKLFDDGDQRAVRLYGELREGATAFIAEGFGPGEARFTNLVARYDAELAHTDDAIRALFAGLRRAGHLDDAIVVVTSDHGEEFLEHGYVEHAWTLYEESLHVPLIVWAPGRVTPTRVRQRVSTLDVVPTVMALSGLSADEVEGVPLFEQRGGVWRPSHEHGPVLAELGIQTRNLLHSVTDGDWKLVVARRWLEPEERERAVVNRDVGPLQPGRVALDRWGPIVREELFDLGNDPGEQRALPGESDRRAALARHLLAAQLRSKQAERARAANPRGEPTEVAPLSDEEREQLEELGYL